MLNIQTVGGQTLLSIEPKSIVLDLTMPIKEQVLYVPGVTMNLLSIGCLIEKNLYCLFGKTDVLIFDSELKIVGRD